MSKATVTLCVASAVIATAPASAQEALGVTLLPVRVVRHGNVAASNAEIDLILGSVTRVVAVSDYAGDVGARVSMQREGAVLSSTAFPCTIGSRADYDAAFALVKAKKPKAALEAFGAFIVRYPDHPYAANALYWRGDCYYAVGDYGSAVAQFEALAIRYPASPKLPDALLKMGLAHKKLGSASKAKDAVVKLKKEFPASEAAKKIPSEDAS